jgi:exonuclease III
MQDLRILCWNVNGLRAINKKGFLDWLQKDWPDVLRIKEIKSREGQLPAEVNNVAGYHTYFKSGDKKGYGGVGLFTRKRPLSVSLAWASMALTTRAGPSWPTMEVSSSSMSISPTAKLLESVWIIS